MPVGYALRREGGMPGNTDRESGNKSENMSSKPWMASPRLFMWPRKKVVQSYEHWFFAFLFRDSFLICTWINTAYLQDKQFHSVDNARFLVQIFSFSNWKSSLEIFFHPMILFPKPCDQYQMRFFFYFYYQSSNYFYIPLIQLLVITEVWEQCRKYFLFYVTRCGSIWSEESNFADSILSIIIDLICIARGVTLTWGTRLSGRGSKISLKIKNYFVELYEEKKNLKYAWDIEIWTDIRTLHRFLYESLFLTLHSPRSILPFLSANCCRWANPIHLHTPKEEWLVGTHRSD